MSLHWHRNNNYSWIHTVLIRKDVFINLVSRKAFVRFLCGRRATTEAKPKARIQTVVLTNISVEKLIITFGSEDFAEEIESDQLKTKVESKADGIDRADGNGRSRSGCHRRKIADGRKGTDRVSETGEWK